MRLMPNATGFVSAHIGPALVLNGTATTPAMPPPQHSGAYRREASYEGRPATSHLRLATGSWYRAGLPRSCQRHAAHYDIACLGHEQFCGARN
jgi:hypothetical protein